MSGRQIVISIKGYERRAGSKPTVGIQDKNGKCATSIARGQHKQNCMNFGPLSDFCLLM